MGLIRDGSNTVTRETCCSWRTAVDREHGSLQYELSLKPPLARRRPRYIKRCTGGTSDRSNHAETQEKSAMSLKPPFTWFRRRGTGGFSDSQYESVAVSGTP